MRTTTGSRFKYDLTGTVKQIPIGTTLLELGCGEDIITAIQVSWTDVTSNAVITLESTNFDSGEVAGDAASAHFWVVEPVTITGPVGAALGSSMTHLGNNGARRIRLRVVASAITQLIVRCWGVH